MFRIRVHGRGGQGIKTGGRILGSALFRAGLTVQDAPRYGAERRGAPMVAYVRAATKPINERGVITKPDLIVVVDASLIIEPAAGVLQGIEGRTVLVVVSREPVAVWRQRLACDAVMIVVSPHPMPPSAALGAIGAGAAARLLGIIDRAALEAAVREEMAALGEAAAVEGAVSAALAGYLALGGKESLVTETPEISADAYARPEWVVLPADDAAIAAPAIYQPATSAGARTGLWRTMRPVVDPLRCHHCVWICGTFCPENAITLDRNGAPQIDYEHCKGCLICAAQCPFHAIDAIPETATPEPGSLTCAPR